MAGHQGFQTFCYGSLRLAQRYHVPGALLSILDQPTGLDTRVHGSRAGGMVAGFDLHDTSSLFLFVLHFLLFPGVCNLFFLWTGHGRIRMK